MKEKITYNPTEQRKTKPKIEDILPLYLEGDSLENAMSFVAWLRKNKMSPGWRSPNSWCSSYKGKVVTYIKLGQEAYVDSDYDSWQIVFFNHYNEEFDDLLDKHIKEIIWSKIRFCSCCANYKCAPGVQAMILGEKLDKNICHYMSLRFNNPNIEELECAKKLALACVKMILNSPK